MVPRLDGEYSKDSVTDPAGPPSGSIRVLRGGGFGSPASVCRSAYRRRGTPWSYRGTRWAFVWPQIPSPLHPEGKSANGVTD